MLFMKLTFPVLPAGTRHEQMVFIAVQIGSCSCSDSVWKFARSAVGWEPYGLFFPLFWQRNNDQTWLQIMQSPNVNRGLMQEGQYVLCLLSNILTHCLYVPDDVQRIWLFLTSLKNIFFWALLWTTPQKHLGTAFYLLGMSFPCAYGIWAYW